MAEVLVERLRAVGVEIDDPEWWTVEAADDVGPDAEPEPGPLTVEVDAWIGAVRRRPAGCPPPVASVDVGALRRIGSAVRGRYEQELADTDTTPTTTARSSRPPTPRAGGRTCCPGAT